MEPTPRLRIALDELAAALLEQLEAEVGARDGGPPELLSVSQVAERLGVARSTVYQELVGTGRLRSLKIGRARRIPANALADLVAGR